jgi:invasion protein IalB
MSEISPPPTRTSFVDGLPPVAINAAVWGGLFIVGALLGWIGRGVIAGPADVPTVQVFQDWRVICPARKNSDKDKNTSKHCTIVSDIADPQSGQTVASVSIMTEVDKDKKESKIIVVNVPLGVALEPGLGLKFGSDTKSAAYKTCLQGGCVAVLPDSDEIEKTIGETSDASIVVAGLDNKSVAVPFSTKGFVEARKAYENFEAKRANLWWRLWI